MFGQEAVNFVQGGNTVVLKFETEFTGTYPPGVFELLYFSSQVCRAANWATSCKQHT